MTQHEYIFVAISIVLGLAMARLLHSAALLVRAHNRVAFHWATALWGVCIFIYIMQLWWVGWELRLFTDWTIVSFFALVIGALTRTVGCRQHRWPATSRSGRTST